MRKILCFLLTLLLLLPALALAKGGEITVYASEYPVTEDGSYSEPEEVAVYLTRYGKLPGNFIRKRDAENLGWSSRDGNLGDVAPGKSIGGDRFGNYEGVLPDEKGRAWTECDIHADGGYRGAERVVFSNDGLIYYTDDHYNTFRQLVVVEDAQPTDGPSATLAGVVEEGGEYYSAEDVAAYLHLFGALPDNYLTKADARDYGWDSKQDNLGEVMPGMCIGGDKFENREGLLPSKKGRTWRQCDVNAPDGARGRERLAYSNDGLIYYSPDNFASFEQLY